MSLSISFSLKRLLSFELCLSFLCFLFSLGLGFPFFMLADLLLFCLSGSSILVGTNAIDMLVPQLIQLAWHWICHGAALSWRETLDPDPDCCFTSVCICVRGKPKLCLVLQLQFTISPLEDSGWLIVVQRWN